MAKRVLTCANPRVQVPQLRSYLRPVGIANATFKQWEEELPPYEPKPSKRKGVDGKPLVKMVTIVDRWHSYECNRRNKAQSLKRIALLESDSDALGLDDVNSTTVALAHDRTLKSVVNMVRAEDVTPKVRAKALERAIYGFAAWTNRLSSR